MRDSTASLTDQLNQATWNILTVKMRQALVRIARAHENARPAKYAKIHPRTFKALERRGLVFQSGRYVYVTHRGLMVFNWHRRHSRRKAKRS